MAKNMFRLKMKLIDEEKYNAWINRGKRKPLTVAILAFLFPFIGYYFIGGLYTLVGFVLIIVAIQLIFNLGEFSLTLLQLGLVYYAYKKAKIYQNHYQIQH